MPKFDASVIVLLFDLREHKAELQSQNVNDVFASYLIAVERITMTVDEMLD